MEIFSLISSWFGIMFSITLSVLFSSYERNKITSKLSLSVSQNSFMALSRRVSKFRVA